MSNFSLVGLRAEAFAALFDLDDAEVRDGSRAAPVIERMLDRTDFAFVHLHDAERGGYSCRAERA